MDRICVNYAGLDFNSLLNVATKYDLQSILKNHGFITRKQSLELQRKSQILILSSWNMVIEKDVIPGKLFEYMMIGRPIIGLISGQVGKSYVKEIIGECELGIV